MANHAIADRGGAPGRKRASAGSHPPLEQPQQQTGSRFLTDGRKAFSTHRLCVSVNLKKKKRLFVRKSGVLMKVLANNWNADKNDHEF